MILKLSTLIQNLSTIFFFFLIVAGNAYMGDSVLPPSNQYRPWGVCIILKLNSMKLIKKNIKKMIERGNK